MLFTAAIDDSADRHRERVVISAAVVGDATRWSYLDKHWRARLKIDGIAYFKSSQCKSRSKQFHRFRDECRYPPPLGEQLAAKIQLDLDAIKIGGIGSEDGPSMITARAYRNGLRSHAESAT